MLPSWLTKLRDVKAGSRQPTQQEPPTTRKPWHDAATSLTKSWSLRRARSQGRNAHFANEAMVVAYQIEDVGRASVHDNQSDACKNRQDSNESPRTAFAHSCFLKGHVVSDTDTEEFALMSETSSTFGSEMSSADSSVSSKCSSWDEGPQVGHAWQQHSNCSPIKLRKNLGQLSEAKVNTELKDSSICAILNSIRSQESAGIELRHETKSVRQFTVFNAGIDEKGGKDTGFIPSDGKKISPDARNSWTFTESSTSTDANDEVLQSIGYGCFGVSASYANEEHMTDQKMAITPNKSTEMEAKSSCRSECSAGEHRAFPLVDINLAVDGCFSQKGIVATDSLSKDLDVTNESASGVLQVSLGGGSQSIALTMQKKRQRGCSISAVLPSDLQGLVGDSLAFVKISEDPYEDFKQSMCEMIMEKGLEESIDIEELLYCYLTLNAPEHHELIKEVFNDVWSSLLMPVH